MACADGVRAALTTSLRNLLVPGSEDLTEHAVALALRGSDGGDAVPMCSEGMRSCQFLQNMLKDCAVGLAIVVDVPARTVGVDLLARMMADGPWREPQGERAAQWELRLRTAPLASLVAMGNAANFLDLEGEACEWLMLQLGRRAARAQRARAVAHETLSLFEALPPHLCYTHAEAIAYFLQDERLTLRLAAAQLLLAARDWREPGLLTSAGAHAAAAEVVLAARAAPSEEVRRRLDDPRATVRAVALDALAAQGARALVPALEHSDGEVRAAAAAALGEMLAANAEGASGGGGAGGEFGAPPGLLPPVPAARRARLVRRLAARLGDGDFGVRRAAAAALARLGGADVAPHVAALLARLEDADGSVSVAAVRALAQLGPAALAAHADAVAARLAHPFARVRLAALHAMWLLEREPHVVRRWADAVRVAAQDFPEYAAQPLWGSVPSEVT